MKPPIVHVVDDDDSVRDSMQTLFRSVSIETVCYASAKEFLEAFAYDRPGCAIVDLRMPGMSGQELQRILSKRGCPLPIIFLTGHGRIRSAVRAMREGAVDFLTKPVDGELLIEVVKKAISNDAKQRVMYTERARIRALVDTLTPREYQVLAAVAKGLSNKEIGRQLEISPKTVELHRAHMMEKMEVQSVAGVVEMYLTVTGIAQTTE